MTLMRALTTWPVFAGPPRRVAGSDLKPPLGPDWLDRCLTNTPAELTALWGEDWEEYALQYWREERIVLAQAPDWMDDPRMVAASLAQLPFELGAMRTLHLDRWQELGWEGEGFGSLHAELGWGCAFKGAGHDRLVSRRWLEYGPWRLIRVASDTTLVQFHDLAADADAALAQSAPGHALLGITPTSGYLYPEHRFRHDVSGLYEAAHRRLKIVVAGRDVEVDEMLDACVVRANQRHDPAKPIERIAYVFIDEAAARRHLHQLWLRELECWALGPGGETRLDEDYRPSARPPAWVVALP
jgi:hypothetical protein